MHQQLPVARKRAQQMNIIGESKSSAKLLNLPPRVQKLRNKAAERKEALHKLAEYRAKKAAKKESEKRRKRRKRRKRKHLLGK